MTRNLSIDLIKVIAMLFVMILHTVHPYDNNYVCFYLATMAGIAIPLFFMVSGYLLINKNGGFRYSAHKILGIVKFIFILTIPTAIIERIFFPIGWFDIKAWIYQFIYPYLQYTYLLWAMWYLGAMCFIYMILPLISNWYRRYGIVFLIVAAILFATICNVCNILNLTFGFEKHIIQTFRIHNWILYFLLGALISVTFNKIKENLSVLSRNQWLCIVIPLSLSFVYSLYLKFIGFPHIWGVEYQFGSSMCIFFTLTTFICMLFMNLNSKITSLIKMLSNLFLPVYVLHVFIIFILNKLMPSFVGEWTCLIKLVIVWVSTIYISYLLMKLPVAQKIFKI